MDKVQSTGTFHHIPVMAQACMDYLLTGPGLYVDGTLGGGGHSRLILSTQEGARLVGIDRDQDAIEAASKVLAPFGDRFTPAWSNYANIKSVFALRDLPKAQGILLDLGVSSYQFDTASRGFSYHEDAPLDMRMDQTQEKSAWDVVNTYDEKRLARVIADYGEERWASRIANFIVNRRPIDTTLQLVDAIKAAVPKDARRDGPHPARRTFQAIRIEVNGELTDLENALRDAASLLAPGGRLCVITFHSLEDRIVKQTFASLQNPCTCPKDFPICVCGKKSLGQVVTRKPVLPTAQELEENPRARSAKLRVFEATQDDA